MVPEEDLRSADHDVADAGGHLLAYAEIDLRHDFDAPRDDGLGEARVVRTHLCELECPHSIRVDEVKPRLRVEFTVTDLRNLICDFVVIIVRGPTHGPRKRVLERLCGMDVLGKLARELQNLNRRIDALLGHLAICGELAPRDGDQAVFANEDLMLAAHLRFGEIGHFQIGRDEGPETGPRADHVRAVDGIAWEIVVCRLDQVVDVCERGELLARSSVVVGVGGADDPVLVPGDDEEHEKAKRLARIIVSDIMLYNQDVIEKGIREGNFYQLLEKDIEEGRGYYQERVPSDVRKGTDYLGYYLEEFINTKRKELGIGEA